MVKVEKVPLREANLKCKTKRNLHDGCLRNKYFVPPYNCSWTTKKNLKRVIKEKVFCLKYSDVRVQPCPLPPMNSLIVSEIEKIL